MKIKKVETKECRADQILYREHFEFDGHEVMRLDIDWDEKGWAFFLSKENHLFRIPADTLVTPVSSEAAPEPEMVALGDVPMGDVVAITIGEEILYVKGPDDPDQDDYHGITELISGKRKWLFKRSKEALEVRHFPDAVVYLDGPPEEARQ